MADLVSDIWNGLRVLKVRNEAAEAVIALHGAHVLSYKPAGEREVLWLSQKSWHEAGKPIRGGIPVCWPWFGPAQEPPHGVARLTEWALHDSVSETGKSVISFEAFAYEDRIAELTVTVADTLRLELTTTNLSADEFRLTEAFHSYFAVSDVTRIRISGLDKAEYLDTLTGMRHIQEEDIRFSAETDRIYDRFTSAKRDRFQRWSGIPGSPNPAACRISATTSISAWSVSKPPTRAKTSAF